VTNPAGVDLTPNVAEDLGLDSLENDWILVIYSWEFLVSICEDSTSPTCSLTSPNGGEVLYAGGVFTITWDAHDPPEQGSEGITGQYLYYSLN